MVVSILVVGDETDVAELFRQRFRREARHGTDVLHFAHSGDQALQLEITIKKTLDEIARVRELDRRRAAAERARANLSRYFSPNLVELLAERDEPLGAMRRQTIAVMFVDIVGFTRMAEPMEPEAVATMLRQFHERMTAQIFACGGTIDKYIGDEILAVFGLPDAGAEDTASALRCADQMIAVIGQ